MTGYRFTLGGDVKCDLARLIETRLLVQANSGGGKSWTLRRLLEQTHGHVQQIVLDPEGEFKTLREKYDYVLAAKGEGDTAADPRSAKLLAERLLELGVSAIIDLYELKAHERVRFVRLFLEALIDAPKRLWHPVLIVLDEAHVYCPQKGEAESASAVIDAATRGRKRGFCLVLATQRLSKLHKDAAAELNNKLIGRTGLDVDMKRAAEELGFTGREELFQLRDLSEGEWFTFGPAISRTVTKVKVGAVQTTHPRPGTRLGVVTPPPTSKIKALLPKLSDLPKEAEERQRTLAELQAENAKLRRELKAKPGIIVHEEKPVIKRVEVPMLKPQDVKRLTAAVEHMVLAADQVGRFANGVRTALTEAMRKAPPEPGRLVTMPRVASAPASPRFVAPQGRPVAEAGVIASDGRLTGPEQRILDAIVWLETIGVSPAEQPAVAFLARYTFNSGGFNNPKGRLHKQGLVRYVGGNRITLTDEGRALAHAPEAALTTEELHRRVLDRLPKPEQRILRPLLEAYPESVGKVELAERADYAPDSGGFNNPLGRLRSLGLIAYPDKGRAVALPLLFLGG